MQRERERRWRNEQYQMMIVSLAIMQIYVLENLYLENGRNVH